MYSIDQLWINLRSSLWFVPSLIVAGAILLAFGLIQLDEQVGRAWLDRWPGLFGAGVEGSRGMLTAIATSIATVAGVTFSITVVALSQASSQYSPLVLRNFMRDRANQTVLGVFGGIFVYCLIVLRAIRGGEDAFVPGIAVLVALLHALAGIGFLLYFVHHIANVLQASSILWMVAKSTLKAIEGVFPEQLSETAGEEMPRLRPAQPELSGRGWHPVHPRETGYVQAIRSGALMSFAGERNAIVRMDRGVGDFVIADAPIAFIALDERPDKEALKAVQDCFIIGEQRTIDQDPAFGVRQIVDMAVKALSPSVNDSTTACSCLNYLAAILVRLASRRMAQREWRENGKLQVIAKVLTFTDFVHLAFHPILENARDDSVVFTCIIDTTALVALHARSASRRQVLLHQLARISEHAAKAVKDENVARRLQRQLTDAVRAVEAAA